MPVIINGTTGVTFPNGVTMSDGTSAPVTIAQGGTGANTASAARTSLGTNDAANITTGAVAIANGGTGSTTAANARTALGTNDAANITAGTLAVARGGTGTASPSLVAGSNISITGTWPNQTVTGTTGAPTTAQVLSATAGLTAGEVGSYVFGLQAASTGDLNFGSTTAGSNIRPTGIFADSSTVGSTLAGTWRCLGQTRTSQFGTGYITVFIRIS